MGKGKGLIGTVISNKMQKTIIVRIVRTSKHPKYGRIVKSSNKFKVHDEKGIAKIGDVVRIQQTRPLSKEKCFMLAEVLNKARLAKLEIKE